MSTQEAHSLPPSHNILTGEGWQLTLPLVRPNGSGQPWRGTRRGITGWGGDGCPSGGVLGLPRPPHTTARTTRAIPPCLENAKPCLPGHSSKQRSPPEAEI